MTGPSVADGVSEAARLVLGLALQRPARLGGTRLVCVDGGAGSGKSTLAEALVEEAGRNGSAHLVHLDDLLDGWEGLFEVAGSLAEQVLEPVRSGRPGRYRRYDWHARGFAEEHLVPPTDVLVVEGVGSGAAAYASLVTLLVWVEAPAHLRLARGLARDGEALRPQWERFMADEERLFAREHTRERADVVVDGTGATDPVVAR